VSLLMPTPEGRSLCLCAPAKVNLFLRILAKRTDGYHDLETWMQKISLYDRIILTLRVGPEIQLRCTRIDLPADKTNLAWRAAAAFFAVSRHGTQYGVDITLEKNIPVAAGLGGGSSDAGAVLKGLNNLFDNELSEDVLLNIGRKLGADVPFFVTGHEAVLATGIGDIMTPVQSLNTCTFLLVNPGFTVSTRWAYENYTLTRNRKNSTLPGFQKFNPDTFLLMTNDLERVTISRYPEIAEIKKRLLDAGAATALMSGSGPTVFGVFPDEICSHQFDINSVSQKLRREYGDKIFTVRAGVGA
jgi:4-diphosphocytidyl-2-C-methyl-D-erythritol kinase